eukprot:1162089-Pelagomonas_calceolata.AAC.3
MRCFGGRASVWNPEKGCLSTCQVTLERDRDLAECLSLFDWGGGTRMGQHLPVPQGLPTLAQVGNASLGQGAQLRGCVIAGTCKGSADSQALFQCTLVSCVICVYQLTKQGDAAHEHTLQTGPPTPQPVNSGLASSPAGCWTVREEVCPSSSFSHVFTCFGHLPHSTLALLLQASRGVPHANVAWALSVWQVSPPSDFLAHLCATATPHLPRMSATSCAVLLTGLADLGHRPKQGWVEVKVIQRMLTSPGRSGAPPGACSPSECMCPWAWQVWGNVQSG